MAWYEGIYHEGHENHHAIMAQEFKTKTIATFTLTIPVPLLSPANQDWFDITITEFGLNIFLLVIFSSVIAIYGASPFCKGVLRSLKSCVPGMNVLVSLATDSWFVYSLGSTFYFTTANFNWEISTLVPLLLFGHWMEMRAVMGASDALNELVKLISPKADLVKGNDIAEVNTLDVKVRNELLIRPGKKVPIDGVVIDGKINFNESMITWESKPISKNIGDGVIGGTINTSG